MKFRQYSSVFLVLLASSAHAFDLGDIKKELGTLNQSPSTAPAASPSALSGFSNQDQVSGLKQALTQGAESAVASLSKENGFLGNDKVRIPLPGSLQKAGELMHTLGMGKYADDLETSMNRAAEAAVPEAKTLMVAAVKNMSVSDAKGILMGGNDAATQYFRRNTETALSEKFRPIVASSMQKVNLAEKYDQFAGKGAKLGLIDQKDANLNDYITRKAMDGLFVMMAEEEKAIRANPMQAAGSLAQKVFSAIKP